MYDIEIIETDELVDELVGRCNNMLMICEPIAGKTGKYLCVIKGSRIERFGLLQLLKKQIKKD